MGLRGAAWGAFIGGRIGGALGALLGAAIGHVVEKGVEKAASSATNGGARPGQNPGGRSARPGTKRAQSAEMAFCACAAAMLAKMAKADGRVTQDEITSVERAFDRLGFSQNARAYAVNVFRRAKDDNHTIYEYAYEFASVVTDSATRELLYELLWDLAAADGVVSREEDALLRRLVQPLAISEALYAIFAMRHGAARRARGGGGARSGGAGRDSRRTSSIDEAYATLGVSPDAPDADVRKAYREKAKQYHPDRLRAQGLPEGMIEKANARMAAVNSAWEEIKKARNIR